MTTVINGQEYTLATTLRVAYMVQNQHNHKPYTEVFQNLGDMPLEDQINVLYAAFACANREQANFITKQTFLDYYLDHYNLKEVMKQLEGVIQGITGTSPEDMEEQSQTVVSSEAQSDRPE